MIPYLITNLVHDTYNEQDEPTKRFGRDSKFVELCDEIKTRVLDSIKDTKENSNVSVLMGKTLRSRTISEEDVEDRSEENDEDGVEERKEEKMSEEQERVPSAPRSKIIYNTRLRKGQENKSTTKPEANNPMRMTKNSNQVTESSQGETDRETYSDLLQ